MVKVAFVTFISFYPLVLTAIASLGALASLLSFQHSMAIALVLSPIVGLYAKYYPKIYRQKISKQQWQNYRSNTSQSTYDFTDNFQQQYQSFRQKQQSQYQYQYQQQQQQQQRQEQRESKFRKREEEKVMDLYNLLSVSQTATDKEIKRTYLLKAKELHPDKNPCDKKAEELFKKVNQAYAILADKYKREQYDKYGYDAVKYN